MAEIKEICKNCKYFVENGRVNHCRRFPPQSSGSLEVFPGVGEDEWCEEWKPKE